MAEKKKEKKTDIEVKPPSIMALTFDIEGLEPGYIGNAWSEEQKKRIPPYPKRDRKIPATEPDFEAIADSQRRVLVPPRDAAIDGFPASALKDAMVRGGMSLTELVGTEMRVQFFVIGGPDGLVPIRGSDWQTFSRTGNLGGKKGSGCIITQPLYPTPWSATICIHHDQTCLTQAQVIGLLELAGSSIGIGAWRPEKKGDYGRFRINRSVEIQVRKVTQA